MGVARLPVIVGGVVAPIAFAVIAAVAGVLEPGYSPVEDHLSGLAAASADHRWLMTAGFLVLGAGALVLAAALRWREPAAAATEQGHRHSAGGPPAEPGAASACGGWRRRSAALVLAVAGASVVLLGLFPRSCVEVACAAPDWRHDVHDAASAPAYLSLLVAPPLLAADRDAARLLALAVAGTTAALFVVFVAAPIDGIGGLVQRLAIALPLGWLVVTSMDQRA